MGLSQEEKEKRKHDANVKAIKITTKDSKEPFVFISYKSDDWEDVLHDIVYKLHKEHGLRVYFDKSFDEHNELWIEQFPDNMESSNCKAVLVFIDDKYATSYATLLELMYSQGTLVARRHSNLKLPVVQINLGELTQIDSKETTGLGKEIFEDGTVNVNAPYEKELFDGIHQELKAKKILNKVLYRGKTLEKDICSAITQELLGKLQINKNEYNKGVTNIDSFCIDLKKTIEQAAGSEVFASNVKSNPKSELEINSKVEVKPDEKLNLKQKIELDTKTILKSNSKTRKMSLADMIQTGILQKGDIVYVQGHPEAEGRLAGGNNILYEGEEISLNQYTKRVFQDNTSRSAYQYVYHKQTGKLLDKLRDNDIPKQAEPELSDHDDIIAPVPIRPISVNITEESVKKESMVKFRENSIYQYEFFGETAQIKILTIQQENKRNMKVDIILLKGSSVKKISRENGNATDYRLKKTKQLENLYNKILEHAEEYKNNFLKVTEDISIQNTSLSAIATMISGASIAPTAAWKECEARV